MVIYVGLVIYQKIYDYLCIQGKYNHMDLSNFSLIHLNFLILQFYSNFQMTFRISLKYESEREVAQSCPTLCDPMDCSLSDSSVHGIFQAIVLEWIAISFSRGSSQGLNTGLPHCRQTLYHLSHQGSPSLGVCM